jgi:hypothetical protein
MYEEFLHEPDTKYLEIRKRLISWEGLHNKFNLARNRKLVW